MFERGARVTAAGGHAERQQEVIRWFDQIYRRKGLAYLRPPEAYGVFLEIIAAEGMKLHNRALLDVACGPGLLLEAARTRGMDVSGVDVSAVALQKASERALESCVTQGSAERLPYGDSSFDVITCLGSLERFLSADRALQEMRRVVRPEGLVLLMVRNSRTWQWSLLNALGLKNEAGHQGAENHESWQQLLEDSGFRVQAVYPDQWPLMRDQRMRRLLGGKGDFLTIRKGVLPVSLANELIYVCRPSHA